MADDGDDLSAIGFLFGGAAAKAEATFHVGGGDGMDITVMAITDEDPGSVQSGQYVWPAAPVLADYAWGQLQQGKLPTAGVCVELGAGCGLCGISVACCPASGFEEVIFTDHDPGTLHQVTENAEAQGDKRRIATRAEPLEWGEAATALPKASLVLGSDVIYDTSVVAPLFKTVDALLDGDGVFAMCQSFPYTPEIEAEMERCVAKLRLARAVEWDRLGEDGGTKLQLFRRQ
mmetsp:Transcript_1698/g.4743  ORF Transcript_1698/g.4743 Transcript_1698/m.4743 type:complete len:232 (-) Transcript_1698:264-959(-)